MQKPNRPLAFLAYLLPLIGPLLVWLLARKNTFALYHACQSLALTLIAIIVPLGWALIAWAMTWVPLAGPMMAAALFALVIAAYLALVVAWGMGLANALRALHSAVPMYGGWGERLYGRLNG